MLNPAERTIYIVEDQLVAFFSGDEARLASR